MISGQQLQMKVLFDNAEGMKNDIPLSDNPKNYRFLMVFYNNNNINGFAMADTSQGSFTLTTIGRDVNDEKEQMLLAYNVYSIKQNTLTRGLFKELIIDVSDTTTSPKNIRVYAGNYSKITKVIGIS